MQARLGGPTFRSDDQRSIKKHQGDLQSLCENSESARFCSARLLSGHSSYRHDPQCPLERRALHEAEPSSHTGSLAPEAVWNLDGHSLSFMGSQIAVRFL